MTYKYEEIEQHKDLAVLRLQKHTETTHYMKEAALIRRGQTSINTKTTKKTDEVPPTTQRKKDS